MPEKLLGLAALRGDEAAAHPEPEPAASPAPAVGLAAAENSNTPRPATRPTTRPKPTPPPTHHPTHPTPTTTAPPTGCTCARSGGPPGCRRKRTPGHGTAARTGGQGTTECRPVSRGADHVRGYVAALLPPSRTRRRFSPASRRGSAYRSGLCGRCGPGPRHADDGCRRVRADLAACASVSAVQARVAAGGFTGQWAWAGVAPVSAGWPWVYE